MNPRQSRVARGLVAPSAALAPVVAGLALWGVGLSSVDVGRVDDLGLISVLTPPVFAGIAMIVVSAGFQIHRQQLDRRVLAVHLVAVLFVLYAIPSIVETAARTATVWAHLGLAEYIARTGTTAQNLDARMNWPGFFIGAAFLSSVAGVDTLNTIAHWAPVIFNLLCLLPLALIARALTRDERLVWASLLLFVLTNWIGQDYFAPQALGYFLYLVIVAVIVMWFLVRRPRSDAVLGGLRRIRVGGPLLEGAYSLLTPDNLEGSTVSRRQQVALVSVIVVLFAFVSYSHQLTPFITISALLALLVFNRISLRTIPILFGVMAVAWVSYATVPFLAGHVVSLIREVGSVTATLSANVTGRIGGSSEHQAVVTVRLVFTLTLWSLAGLGALIRFRDGRRDLTLLLLAAAPFPLLALQAYGGEIVLRLYLFSLPFVAILVAGLVYGRGPDRPPTWASVIAVFVSCVVAFGFLVTRYGNERFELMTSSEVAAVNELYRTAPPGSLLLAGSYNLPWKFEKFEQYEYVANVSLDLGAFATTMRNPKYEHSYLILTSSQGAFAEVFDGLPPGSWDRFVAEANASPAFRVIYRNQDSEILVLAEKAAISTPP